MKKTCNYYVVKMGRQKGVFDTWATCIREVYGVSNSYCGCSSWQEVQDVVLFDMPDTGPYVYEVAGHRVWFKTYEKFRDFVLEQIR